MHAAEREQVILRMLQQRGFIAFQDLDRELEASPATLRRDLEKLETAGHIVRVHGGAKLPGSQNAGAQVDVAKLLGVPFRQNVQKNLQSKRAIGKAAAELCCDGESIIIDGGSTTLQICSNLGGFNLQVLSNSLHVIGALLPLDGIRMAIPAGTVFREQDIILSPFNDDGMTQYRASKIFMGAAAVGIHGVMQTDAVLAQIGQRLLARAEKLVLLVDSSKFKAPAGHIVCGLSEIDVLVTDVDIADEHAQMLERAGIRLIVADAISAAGLAD